jgi:fructose-1,6-bisphosphatase/inositol monophosphatase family enzyme
MLDDAGLAAVEALIRRTAAEIVVPLFGALTAGDIQEKAPGDLVTVADRRAEELLSRELPRILPGSRVVGEEAVYADPSITDLLKGPDPVWIIDPVDGTEAFAGGSPRFTTLVALARNGQLLASWTYAPLLGFMATATNEGPALVDSVPVRVRPGATSLRHLDVWTPRTQWWTPEQKAQFHALYATGVSASFFDYSGLAYIDLAAGRRSAMILPWELPWDHAAGVLLLTAAGGVVIGMDGRPFQVAGGNVLPLIAAADETTALMVRDGLQA